MKKIILLAIVTLSVNIVTAQWTQTNGPNTGHVLSITISNTNIFAGTWDGVFLSSDNGQNWTAVNNGLPEYTYAQSLAISGTNIFAGTDGGGVFLSSDNGANWIAINNGLPENTEITSLAISGTNIFAGTFESGVWKRPLSELSGIKEISNNESNIVIYPNPNRGKFTIAQTTNDIKSIEIYNVMGEIVYKSRASNTKLQIDISAQPKGIYFVKVDNGEKVHVEKIVLN